jgi:hypothetical protein
MGPIRREKKNGRKTIKRKIKPPTNKSKKKGPKLK